MKNFYDNLLEEIEKVKRGLANAVGYGYKDNVYYGMLLSKLEKIVRQNPSKPVTPCLIRQAMVEAFPDEFQVVKWKSTWRGLLEAADALARQADKHESSKHACMMRDVSDATHYVYYLASRSKHGKSVQFKANDGAWYWCPFCWRPVKGGYLHRPSQCDLHNSNSAEYQVIIRLVKNYYDKFFKNFDSKQKIAIWKAMHDYLPVKFLHEARKATDSVRTFAWQAMQNVRDYNYLPVEFRNKAQKAKNRIMLTYAWDSENYEGVYDDMLVKQAWSAMLDKVNREDYVDYENTCDDVLVNISSLPRIEDFLEGKQIQIGPYPKITEVLKQLAKSDAKSEPESLPEMDFREKVAMLTRAEAWLMFMATKPGRGGKRLGAGRPKKK